MIEFIRNLIEEKTAEIKNRVSAKKAEMSLWEQVGNIVTERPDSDGFIRVGGAQDEKGFNSSTQNDMIKNAREFYRKDPHGKAVIQSMVNYVIGTGVVLTPKSDNPIVQWIWKEFSTAKRNKWKLKQFEIIRRAFRDGEVFIRLFDRDENGNPTGKTTIRFIEPRRVQNPVGEMVGQMDRNNTRNGIETMAGDRETVLAYWVKVGDGLNDFEKVSAEEMVHIKLDADSDQDRGDSLLLPVMKFLKHYQDWMINRILLNKIRTAIVLIRKITGTSSDVSRISSVLAQASNQRSGETKKESIKGGSIITANQGVEYDMLSPNINASDVKDDGRAIKLNIAAGTNIPEYLLGDASNANYASTLIAESPFVKGVEYWQIFFEQNIALIYEIVIRNAVKGKLVKEPSDEGFLRAIKGIGDLSEQEGNQAIQKFKKDGKLISPSEIFYGVDATWPEIIHRNPKEFAEALVLARGQGWVSDSECAQRLGFDYEEQIRRQRQIEEMANKEGNPLLGVKTETENENEDETKMRDEISSILNTLEPDEREKLMKSNDPVEMARMVLNRMGQGQAVNQ